MATRIPITKDSFGFEDRQDDIWQKMEHDMERRRKEWENEIEKMSTDFFSMRPDRTQRSFDPIQDRIGIAESHDDGKSVIEKNEHGQPVFKARFNVKDYKPEEVNVKMDANKIIVQAKHEENSGGASVSREYCREVNIPKEIDPLALQCSISPEGKLTVEAPVPVPDYQKDAPVPAPDYQREAPVPAPDYQREAPVPAPDYQREAHVPAPDYLREAPGTPTKISISQSSNASHSPYHSGTSSPASFQHPQQQQRVSTPPYKPQPTQFTPPPVNQPQQFQSPPSSGQFQQPSSGSSYGQYPSHPGSSGQFQVPPYQGQSHSKTPQAFNTSVVNSSSTQRTASPVGFPEKKFKVEADIEDFNPEDLTVKTQDKKIVITARKEVKTGNRTSTREMSREFAIPENVDPYSVKAFFTEGGKLILEAPYRQTTSGQYSNGGGNHSSSPMTGR
ncbi:serine/arginine repetitive matrix protein 1-like [Haliotis rufescens]|uniref:serine/arginine repetitive matrix protein 1-like n=1 Tax=Haliotis rufescens TaxID=6454 RepID=UPI001EB02C91|nr:serine/arginine repetitive matrix protein 1-like [Haliotis rufescens]XP_046340727.1 serine/arginine repetitive matrix protein 1-like [Haliotis rufescens]XP_046340728.1 serine/arginine repetitive matrix protein 1-like [Haliotis rufescens]